MRKEAGVIFALLLGSVLVFELAPVFVPLLPQGAVNLLWPLTLPAYIDVLIVSSIRNTYFGSTNIGPVYWALLGIVLYVQTVVLTALYLTVRYVLSHLRWNGESAA